MAKRLNCWEFKQCGREEGGAKVDELGVCAASTLDILDGLNGGVNGGRICWYVAGTLCKGEVQGTFAQKRLTCLSCDFFTEVSKQEGAGRIVAPAHVRPGIDVG